MCVCVCVCVCVCAEQDPGLAQCVLSAPRASTAHRVPDNDTQTVTYITVTPKHNPQVLLSDLEYPLCPFTRSMLTEVVTVAGGDMAAHGYTIPPECSGGGNLRKP